MSTLTTFCTIVAALSGIILLGSVSPASAYRSFTFEPNVGKNYAEFREGSIDNTTIFYSECEVGFEVQKECTLYRVQADLSGGSPKQDECKVTLRSESGGIVPEELIDIQSLGKHRAILRWAEINYFDHESWVKDRKSYLRIGIVDFSNCEVKTTKISNDLNLSMIDKKRTYEKGEDNFVLISSGKMSVDKTSIDAEGVASKVDTWLAYQADLRNPPTILPLSKDKGYLVIEVKGNGRPSMTVALVQSNGQRQNLTHIEGVYYPAVSLANGLIGICGYEYPSIFMKNEDTVIKCTQFKLGEKEINWFSISTVDRLGFKQAIYNLPKGEGFLIRIAKMYHEEHFTGDKYLLKIGLDGKAKQFVDPDMKCEDWGFKFDKFFQDDRGNYCLSTVCSDPKLQTKCFEPEEFKNITNYEIKAEGSDYPGGTRTLLIE